VKPVTRLQRQSSSGGFAAEGRGAVPQIEMASNHRRQREHPKLHCVGLPTRCQPACRGYSGAITIDIKVSSCTLVALHPACFGHLVDRAAGVPGLTRSIAASVHSAWPTVTSSF
jgi:hypothetical protein